MNCYAPLEKLVSGKEVAVIGVGVSNIPLIHLLLQLHANVVAYDKRTSDELGPVYNELTALGVSFSLGTHYLENLTQNIIFKTPGMRFDQPELVAAQKRGAVVTSEMEQFFELCPAVIYGITGSDGKTTTSTIIYELLKEEGYRCWLGGNIGTPLLDQIPKMTQEDRVVLELSSFQLHTLRKSPHVAVMTNISPNHLDMHKDYQEYIDAKKNIMRYQTAADILVTNSGNAITCEIGKTAKGSWRCFSTRSDALVHLRENMIYYGDEPVLDWKSIKIPGMHNVENYMAAIAATYDDVSVATVRKIAASFGGVSHRIEFVRELHGIRFYNDSIATTPTRSAAALNAFEEGIVLIAGGYDKGIPFDDFGVLIAQKVKELVILIDTPSGPKIRDAAVRAGMKQITEVLTFQEAVECAYRLAKSGDVVLLSTACASFGMFKNFMERGEIFRQMVENLS